jgi:RHS repeat-associated protein
MTIKARPLRIEDDQLVVTIPVRSLAALKSDPAVLYLERVGGTADDESPLIGEPVDPQPGAQSKHLTPHALGAISWDSGTYAYDGAGNIVSIGTDKYLYDGVQRLKQSSTQGSIETYTYDGFGNMKTRTNVTLPSIDSATNRYMGYNYNQIGAVTSDGSYTFTYDALGQPLRKVYNNQSNTVEDYVYTPGDERIGVQRGGWWTWSVRDEGGKVLRQYKSSATNLTDPALWLEDFVWRDGLLLGSQRPVEMGGRRHFHLDHLGTARLITSDSGQMVSYHDYYPFGDEYSPVMQESSSGFGREEPMKFTGHERDYAGGMGAEDGHALDYMHARYYSPTAARFLSVDPTIALRPTTTNPQMWNRYTYVHNKPADFTDPTGHLAATFVLASNALDEVWMSTGDFGIGTTEGDGSGAAPTAQSPNNTTTPTQPTNTSTSANGNVEASGFLGFFLKLDGSSISKYGTGRIFQIRFGADPNRPVMFRMDVGPIEKGGDPKLHINVQQQGKGQRGFNYHINIDPRNLLKSISRPLIGFPKPIAPVFNPCMFMNCGKATDPA